MKHMLRVFLPLFAILLPSALSAHDVEQSEWSIAIHGGAGTIERSLMTPEREAAYNASLRGALDAGAAVLRDGGTAEDAVIAVITLLEDDPLFNAGRGAVLTWEGRISLDSSLMLGHDLSAGGAAGVADVRHPILLAQAVMRNSPHVLLSGEGASEFAGENGLELVDSEWFITPERQRALEAFRNREEASLEDREHAYGTVGAVARDVHGNLAAGTSTGGMTGKRWGRIGDSPLIGAGTYADNRACAVSATGTGEYFIRASVARAICDLMRLTGMGPQEAADQLITEVEDLGGVGGVIVISNMGETAYSFNTSGMYRGRADSNGMSEVSIYGD